jgi:hypothetical protein
VGYAKYLATRHQAASSNSSQSFALTGNGCDKFGGGYRRVADRPDLRVRAGPGRRALIGRAALIARGAEPEAGQAPMAPMSWGQAVWSSVCQYGHEWVPW